MISLPGVCDGKLPVAWHSLQTSAVRFGRFERPDGDLVLVGWQPLEGKSGVLHVPSVEVAREIAAACPGLWLGGKVAARDHVPFLWPSHFDAKTARVVEEGIPTISGGHAPELFDEPPEVETVAEVVK